MFIIDNFELHTVPRSCVYELWESFNDIAEGFGLTIEEFQEIVKSAIMEYLSVTERQLNFDTDAVFRLFDDDEVRLNTEDRKYSVSTTSYQKLLYCLEQVGRFSGVSLCLCHSLWNDPRREDTM